MQDFEKNSMKKSVSSKKRWRWGRNKEEKDAIQLKPLNSGQCHIDLDLPALHSVPLFWSLVL